MPLRKTLIQKMWAAQINLLLESLNVCTDPLPPLSPLIVCVQLCVQSPFDSLLGGHVFQPGQSGVTELWQSAPLVPGYLQSASYTSARSTSSAGLSYTSSAGLSYTSVSSTSSLGSVTPELEAA